MDLYRKELLGKLFELYKDGILCDVTFHVDDVTIRCHRNVMAAASPYFRAMFTNPVIEKDEENIQLHDVQPDMLAKVIGFIYTGDIQVTNENAQDLIVAGTMFELPHLIGRCTDHMVQELCLENCVEVFIFAGHFACERLKQHSKQYILEHFTEIINGEDKIYELEINDIENLVSSDDLCVENEEIVFEFISKWTEKDKSRHHHFSRLFNNIRLSLLDDATVTTAIKQHPIVSNSTQCQQMLRAYDRQRHKHISDNTDNENNNSGYHPSASMLNSTPRQGMFNRTMLVFSGGGNSECERSLSAFDPLTFKNYMGVNPHPTFDFKFKVDHYQLASLSGKQLFFLGGIFYDQHHLEDFGHCLRDVYQFDAKEVRWIPKACMRVARCCFSVSSASNQLFAIGGKSQFPRGEPTDSVEVYDVEHDVWQSMSPLPIKLYAHTSTSTSDALFVFGGKDDDDDFLDTVFRYDIMKDSWTLVTTHMHKPRAFASAFAYKQLIYIVGGVSVHENILTVSIYNPMQNKWSFGADFPEERKVVSAGFFDGTIFVCGGVRHMGVSGRRTRQVESRDLYSYDINGNTWRKLVKLVQYGNPNVMAVSTLNTKYLTESDFVSSM